MSDEDDIYQFAAHAKIALISEEFSRECFDFGRFSASCLGGLVVRHEQKEAVLFFESTKVVLAVLPTGFGNSLVHVCQYLSFALAKETDECSVGCSPGRLTFLVIVREDSQSCNPL